MRCAANESKRSRGCPSESSTSCNRRQSILRGIGLGFCGCSGCISKARRGWYDKYFAYSLSHSMGKYENMIMPTKTALFAKIRESGAKSILEVGVGYGPNSQYYGESSQLTVVGLDPNPEMKDYAVSSAQAAGMSDFRFLEGYAENIPVEEDTFDAAVCTLVLCSVGDVTATLKECQRVIKPGGKFYFIEHVAAAPGSFTLFAQKLLNPLQGLIADGCHLDRNTLQIINKAGFLDVQAEKFELPMLGILANHVSGFATV